MASPYFYFKYLLKVLLPLYSPYLGVSVISLLTYLRCDENKLKITFIDLLREGEPNDMAIGECEIMLAFEELETEANAAEVEEDDGAVELIWMMAVGS